MSNRTSLHLTLWGRPIKPLSFALMLATFVIIVINTFSLGLIQSTTLGHILITFASAAVAGLFGGWLLRSQWLMEIGLLLSVGVWTTRFFFIIFTEGIHYYGAYLSVAWAIAAGGAYLLERMDDRWTQH